MAQYPGPDKEFGEHDDYEVGDVVWTYDNEAGIVSDVLPSTPHDYEVLRPDGSRRTYDVTRLALVARGAASRRDRFEWRDGDVEIHPPAAPRP